MLFLVHFNKKLFTRTKYRITNDKGKQIKPALSNRQRSRQKLQCVLCIFLQKSVYDVTELEKKLTKYSGASLSWAPRHGVLDIIGNPALIKSLSLGFFERYQTCHI